MIQSGRGDMRMIIARLLSGCLFVLASTWGYADDTSKQIQMLNSQLQVQLQRMQEAQQKQVEALSKQFQSQLADTQQKLQDQIKSLNTATQKQMESMQKALDAKIQKVHEEVLTGGDLSTANNSPSNEAPATVTDGTIGNTGSTTKQAPGLQ